MRRAVDRFWSWLFHPSILRQNYPDQKAVAFRHPSPGNQPNVRDLEDYREPFATSVYNIRYRNETAAQQEGFGSYFVSDPVAGYASWEQKLVAHGLLKKGEESNKELVDKAKQAYFQRYNVPIEKTVYRNDFGYKMPVKGDRESFRYVAELGIRTNRAILERMPGKSHQDVYNPHSIPIESLDMFAGDPNYQQAMMEVTYAIDNYCEMVRQAGQIEVVRGNRHFWKALDDINDPQNIVAVQTKIGDSEPLDFSLANRPIKLVKDKEGRVVDVLP